MLRSRIFLFALVLALAVLPCPGWSAEGTLDQLVARTKALEDREYDEEISETEIRNFESEFISLLRQDPGERVATELAAFYDNYHWSGKLTSPDPALLDIVRTSQDPAGLARLLLAPTGESDSPLHVQIAVAALAVSPTDAGLWDQAAKVMPDAAWKITFQEEAFRVRLAAPSSSSDAPTAPALAARWLGRLLEKGFLHRAVLAYRELPPAIRPSFENVSSTPDNNWRDPRLELAAAAFLDGDRELAGQLLRTAVQHPVARSSQGVRPEQDALLFLRRLMERALSSPTDDGFDLLTESTSDFMIRWPLAGSMLNARLAEREAYPALAAFELDQIVRILGYEDSSFDPGSDVPARLRTIREGIDAERKALLLSFEDQARAAEAAASTSLGPDPAAPVIARLLAKPPVPVFSEHPLPEGIEPVDLSDEQIEAQLKEEARGAHLPSGLSVIRVGQDGQKIAAIVESQALDPVGEISAGAYWVVLSDDGGATWGDPLYTGLRINQPYVVRPVSNLPLLDGDHLRLEVEVRELDPTQIVFPPISLPVKRTAKALFLDLPLAALSRDQDGDGLTDLVEARLLTDPNLADSDGDGQADGDDLLPGVPQSADASAATEALAAVMKKIAGVGRRAIVEGIDGTPAGVSCDCPPKGVPPVIVPTVYLVGERPLFTGLSPDRRIVILTRAEVEAARNIIGPFYPVELSLFLFDHSGRRALVLWSASWQGGRFSVEEKDGQWIVKELSSWIT
ncbi:MAG TPA: thrombospondin type 3 repeat-containing protein [Thermoanaerobaculia bacterium]|jgi:hypothetical protein|nr:thrombospondin type 3 repeat-containing protein [Thermoanaerobaculia bacterium]